MALGAVLPLVLITATASSSAGTATCRVKNLTQDTWAASADGSALTRSLTRAVDGDHLRLAGICTGSFAPSTDVTISGPLDRAARPVIQGTGTETVPVFTVPDYVSVRLLRVSVTGGAARGIHVHEGGDLELRASRVHHNAATGRAGAGILVGGSFAAVGVRIDRNSTNAEGGGLFNYGVTDLLRTTIVENSAAQAAGGAFNEGSMTVRYSVIRRNVPDDFVDVAGAQIVCSWIGDQPPSDCD